jgi:hypothetical protein
MIVVCAIDRPLGHHFHQVAQTEFEPKIPAHAQDDDFAVEVVLRGNLDEASDSQDGNLAPRERHDCPLG